MDEHEETTTKSSGGGGVDPDVTAPKPLPRKAAPVAAPKKTKPAPANINVFSEAVSALIGYLSTQPQHAVMGPKLAMTFYRQFPQYNHVFMRRMQEAAELRPKELVFLRPYVGGDTLALVDSPLNVGGVVQSSGATEKKKASKVAAPPPAPPASHEPSNATKAASTRPLQTRVVTSYDEEAANPAGVAPSSSSSSRHPSSSRTESETVSGVVATDVPSIQNALRTFLPLSYLTVRVVCDVSKNQCITLSLFGGPWGEDTASSLAPSALVLDLFHPGIGEAINKSGLRDMLADGYLPKFVLGTSQLEHFCRQFNLVVRGVWNVADVARALKHEEMTTSIDQSTSLFAQPFDKSAFREETNKCRQLTLWGKVLRKTAFKMGLFHSAMSVIVSATTNGGDSGTAGRKVLGKAALRKTTKNEHGNSTSTLETSSAS